MAEYPNQCIGCGRSISWSRWFCNLCAEEEGLTVKRGLAPSKPKKHTCRDGVIGSAFNCPACGLRSEHIDGPGSGS